MANRILMTKTRDEPQEIKFEYAGKELRLTVECDGLNIYVGEVGGDEKWFVLNSAEARLIAKELIQLSGVMDAVDEWVGNTED